MRKCPYINVSRAAINSNKMGGFPEVNTPQYTSHYKTNHMLSILPIQAHFNSNKYRSKKPIPSNNTYVSIKGFLEDVDMDSNGHATMFHISADNINFLKRVTIIPSATGNIDNILLLPLVLYFTLYFGFLKSFINPSSPSSSTKPSVLKHGLASNQSKIDILTQGEKRKK